MCKIIKCRANCGSYVVRLPEYVNVLEMDNTPSCISSHPFFEYINIGRRETFQAISNLYSVFKCIQGEQDDDLTLMEWNAALPSSLWIYMSVKNNLPSAYKTKSWVKVFQSHYKHLFLLMHHGSELKATIVSGCALGLSLNFSLAWVLLRKELKGHTVPCRPTARQRPRNKHPYKGRC